MDYIPAPPFFYPDDGKGAFVKRIDGEQGTLQLET